MYARTETAPPAPGAVAVPDVASTAQRALLGSLHLGMGWHHEQPGGLNRMVAGLIRHLPQAGVTARALVAGSADVERLSDGACSTFGRLDDPLPLRLWRAGRAVRAEVRDHRPDLVAVHFPLFALAAAASLRGLPKVVHFHGPWADEGRVEGNRSFVFQAKRSIELTAQARADRFIVLSKAFAAVLERDYRVDPAQIRVVPGGVDSERFTPIGNRSEARAILGLPRARPLVVSVRRLARRMGLEDLIAAFDRVRSRIPDALLLIAGTGPAEEALAARIAELDLAAHVRLLGRIDDSDLPDLYRAADLTVVPSTALEGFGLTAAESLASGTPALVTPVGGLPEVVAELEPDLVLPVTGPDAMAERIVAALSGAWHLPDDRACAAYARRRFAWPVVAAGVAAVYAEVTPR